MNDTLYNYRLSPSGRGRNFKIKYINDYEEVRQHVYNNLLDMNVSSDTLEKFFSRYIEGLMDYMGRIIQISSSYQEFTGYCEMIKNFKLYTCIENIGCTVKLEDKKADAVYRLFRGENYRILYINNILKNMIRGILNHR